MQGHQVLILTAVATIGLGAYAGHVHNGLIGIAALALPFVVWAWHLRQKR